MVSTVWITQATIAHFKGCNLNQEHFGWYICALASCCSSERYADDAGHLFSEKVTSNALSSEAVGASWYWWDFVFSELHVKRGNHHTCAGNWLGFQQLPVAIQTCFKRTMAASANYWAPEYYDSSNLLLKVVAPSPFASCSYCRIDKA